MAVSIDTPEQTKVGSDINGDGVVGNGGAFDTNDEFTLYLATKPDETIATNKKADYKYNTNTKNWDATPPLYWDNQAGCPFSAISPKYTTDGKYKITENGAADTYSVEIDQSDATKQKTSDLLIARSTVTNRLLKVNFHHVFCRVVVQLTAATTGDGAFAATDFNDAVVTLNGIHIDAEITYPTDGTVTDGTVIATATTTGTGTNVTMCKLSASNTLPAVYSAIIPQQALTERPLVTITLVKGNTYTYSYKSADLLNGITAPFAQGKETTIKIKLTKKNVVGNISITGWGDGPTVTDNEAIVLPK